MSKRDNSIVIYVQHLLGIGHLMRAARLAEAFAAAGWDSHLISGGFPVPDLPLGKAVLHQLPAVRAADARFSALVTADGQQADADWFGARQKILCDLARDLAPDVIMTEQFPFGRRAFRAEIVALLSQQKQREAAPLIVGSVRDIVVARKPARHRETVATIRDHYDQILVHGDPDLIDFGASFPLVDQIEKQVCYTGYIDGASAFGAARADASGTGMARSADSDGDILVSSGGGAVGRALCDTAVGAALADPKGRCWRVLVGHAVPSSTLEQWQQQVRDADGRLIVERARPDFRALLSKAAVSVSQAGYNTIIDLIVTGCPAVLVPFEHDNETEQRQRAAAMTALGCAHILPEDDLSAANLLRAMDDLPARADLPALPPLSLQGAANTVAQCAAWLRQKRRALT